MAMNIVFTSFWLITAVQSSTAIEQVPPPASSAQEQPQNILVTAGNKLDGTDRLVTDQVNSNDSAPSRALQLTTEPSGREVDQLGRPDRNMQSSPDLSSRKQGFETKVVKLEGTDRCSAELLSTLDRQYCQSIIENRSAEYAGQKAIELTPEQKLLSARNLRMLAGDIGSAVRRLSTGRNSAEDRDEQAIASIVLGDQTITSQLKQEQPTGNELSAETQALLDAIVKNVGGNPGT